MQEKEIDLSRMERLLNGIIDGQDNTSNDKEVSSRVDINNDDSSTTSNLVNLHYEKEVSSRVNNDALNDSKQNTPDDNTQNKIDELFLILHKKGKMIGYSNVVEVEYLYNDIMQNLQEESFKNASGIVIHLDVNEEVSMFKITDVMEKLYDLYKDNSKVLFEATPNNDFNVDEIGYSIVITGL